MKSGKLILMVIVVLASAVSIVTFHELDSNENSTIFTDNYSFQEKTLKVELSDGVSSTNNG